MWGGVDLLGRIIAINQDILKASDLSKRFYAAVLYGSQGARRGLCN